MRKAIIIGLGGTGIDVIKRVRTLIEWQHNVTMSQVQFVKFLGMDTSLDRGEPIGPDFVHLQVSSERIRSILQERQQQHIHNWLDPDVVGGAGAIQDGAGSVRMIGKLAFLEHFRDFHDMLRQKMDHLIPLGAAAIPPAMAGLGAFDGRVKIYVVGNAVSGTGSGGFVDVGFAVRHYINNDPQARLNAHEITAIMTLPDDLQDKLKMANCYYALEELNHYISDNHNYQIDDPLSPGQMLSVPNQYRPFDFVYLLDTNRGLPNDPIHSHEQLEEVIGEYIFNDIFSPDAAVRDGRRDDVRQHFHRPDALGYFSRCMTFGMATIAYPITQVARACTFRFLVETINWWFNMSGPDTTSGKRPWASMSYQSQPSNIDPTPYPAILGRLCLGDGDHNTAGSLHNALLQPMTLGGKQVDVKGAIARLIDQTLRTFRGQSSALDRMEEQLERAFSGRWEYREGEGLPPGIVDEIIRQNSVRLMDQVPGQLKDEVVRLTFANHSGSPHSARKLLDEYIAKRLEALKTRGGADEVTEVDLKGRMQSVKEDLDELEKDLLMNSPMDLFRQIARRRVLLKYREAIVRYFNAKLTTRVMDAQAGIANGLEPTVALLSKRLSNFHDYMTTGWRTHLIRDYEAEIEPVPVNGYDLLNKNPEQEVSSQYASVVTEGAKQNRIQQCLTELGKPGADLRKDLEVNLDTVSRFDREMMALRTTDPKTGAPTYRRYRPHEDALIQPVRANFHNVLGQQDILERFLVRGTEEDVRETEKKSQLFISAPLADVHSIPYDMPRMMKKWFFYPGGHTVPQGPPALPTNETQQFATMLNQALGNIDWANESKDSHDRHTILFLRERGAFPVRLINHLQTMRNAAHHGSFTPTKKEWVGRASNPLASRVDVNFTPLDMNDRNKLVHARQVFLVAVAAGLLERDGQTFRLSGTQHAGPVEQFIGQRSQSLGGVGPLPIRPLEAAYVLYKNNDWLNSLEQRIDDARQSQGEGTMVVRIYAMLSAPEKHGLNLSASERDAVFDDILIGYVKADPVLLAAWDQTYPDMLLSGMRLKATYHRADVLQGGTHPRDGFYCNRCGGWVLNSEKFKDSQGNPDPGQLPEKCENPFCGGQTG